MKVEDDRLGDIKLLREKIFYVFRDAGATFSEAWKGVERVFYILGIGDEPKEEECNSKT